MSTTGEVSGHMSFVEAVETTPAPRQFFSVSEIRQAREHAWLKVFGTVSPSLDTDSSLAAAVEREFRAALKAKT